MYNNKKKIYFNKKRSIFEGVDLNCLGQKNNSRNIDIKKCKSAIIVEENNKKRNELFYNEQYINESNDLPIMNEIKEKNEQFCSILKKRIKGLNNVVTYYNNNYYNDAISQISLCKDLGVANDFFIYGVINKNLNCINLNTDDVIKLFPIILNLCDSKYNIYFKTGINTAWVILKMYYDRIISAKKSKFNYGVDLNREEKLKKYDIIFDFFYKLSNLDRVNINLRNNIEGLNLIQFFCELDHFIKECLIN